MSTEENDNDYPFKSRVWGAIETLKSDVLLLQERFKINDRDIDTRERFFENLQSRLDEDHKQYASVDKRLIHLEEKLNHISERLDDMWRFPMKTMAFIAATASTITVIWKIIKSLLPKVGHD